MRGTPVIVLRHLDGKTYDALRLSDCYLLDDGTPQGIMVRIDCVTELNQK